jgi:hypothetical protein
MGNEIDTLDRRAAELLRRARALEADASQPEYARRNARSVVDALESSEEGLLGPAERLRRLKADLPHANSPEEVQALIGDDLPRVADDIARLERSLPAERPPAPVDEGPAPADEGPAPADEGPAPAAGPEPSEAIRIRADRREGRVLENPAERLPRSQRIAVDTFQEQFNELYKGGATSGDGSTAFAALKEQAAGGVGRPPRDVVQPGTLHRDKCDQLARGLERMLNDAEVGGRLPPQARQRVEFEIKKLREARDWADAVHGGERLDPPRWARPWRDELELD